MYESISSCMSVNSKYGGCNSMRFVALGVATAFSRHCLDPRLILNLPSLDRCYEYDEWEDFLLEFGILPEGVSTSRRTCKPCEFFHRFTLHRFLQFTFLGERVREWNVVCMHYRRLQRSPSRLRTNSRRSSHN